MEDFIFNQVGRIIEDSTLPKTGYKKDRRVLIVYNPHLRKMIVHWVDWGYSSMHTFEDCSEWVYINHPYFEDQYVAVQLDYDECSQLICYFEQHEDDESAEYSDCISWHSGGHKDSPIFIAENSMQFEIFYRSFEQIEYYPKVDEIKLKPQP